MKVLTLVLVAILSLPIVPAMAEEEGSTFSDSYEQLVVYTEKDGFIHRDRLVKLAPGATVYTEQLKDSRVAIILHWKEVAVRVVLGFQGNFDAHIDGFRNYLKALPEFDKAKHETLLQEVTRFSRYTYSIQISRGFDSGGTARTFISALANELPGKIFFKCVAPDGNEQPVVVVSWYLKETKRYHEQENTTTI